MAAPGPHPTNQPNTPPPPGRPWLPASGSLSLFFKLFGVGDRGRISSLRP